MNFWKNLANGLISNTGEGEITDIDGNSSTDNSTLIIAGVSTLAIIGLLVWILKTK